MYVLQISLRSVSRICTTGLCTIIAPIVGFVYEVFPQILFRCVAIQYKANVRSLVERGFVIRPRIP